MSPVVDHCQRALEVSPELDAFVFVVLEAMGFLMKSLLIHLPNSKALSEWAKVPPWRPAVARRAIARVFFTAVL